MTVSPDIADRLEAFAKIVEGRVVTDDPRFEVNIRGTVLGFPATMQSMKSTWPFGCTYTIETNVIMDPNKPADDNELLMTLTPRMTRGIWAFFARILLFEPRGQHVFDKRMEEHFIFSFNDSLAADRLMKYPGVFDNILHLQEYSHFSELTIKTGAGLVLSQPKNFASLDPDVFRDTFRVLADIGQIMSEAF